MSANTRTDELADFRETEQATPPPGDDDAASVHQQDDPISALAIDFQHGKCGFAVFLEEEQQLLLCEDLSCDFAFDNNTQMPSVRAGEVNAQQGEDLPACGTANASAPAFGHPSYGVVESLLSQFEPGLIVVSSRCPEAFLTMLRSYAEQRSGSVEVRPGRDFQMALGLSSIEESTAFSRANASNDVTAHFTALDDGPLGNLVALDAKVATARAALSISAAAPLLSSLRSRRDIGRSLTLVSMCLDDYLFVDDNTLKSLSICSSDIHGFVHAKGGREGFSILVSQPLLKRWVMLPLAKRTEIVRRHEAVELLVRQEASSEVVQIRSKLAELGGIPHLCFFLNMGTGTALTWDKLLRTCNAIIRIKESLNSLDLRMSEMTREIKERITTEPLLRLSNMIQHIIDFDTSKEEGRITVDAGVDVHLDELREQYARIPALLDRVAAEIMKEPAFRSTTRAFVVYFPQIGYVIKVAGGEVVDMLADPSLEQQFASPSDVYLKNSRMRDMDQHLGDVASFIVDKEIEVLEGLSTMLNECGPALLTAHAACTQLDCLLAFARAATLYDLRRPTLVEEQVIRLQGSRHALKALSDESFVPNDIDLKGGIGIPAGGDEPFWTAVDADNTSRQASAEAEHAGRPAKKTDEKFSVMVLTGANSSGKSCLLQQAALAVFLCQCGSFVPATHAELGVFDKILTRMRQDESVVSEGSSFTRELGRLHRAMAMSTRRSLVILDEVGRECRSDDGAGLFIATIYEFLQRGDNCPIVLSATHHLRAIEKHLPPSLPIQRAHMQTILLPTLADTYDSLTYLFRLKPGFAGTSHACHCARLCGVPENVVERADRICRIGLRAWHDSEAMKDEAIVRRLLQLELGNDDPEGEESKRIKSELKKVRDDEAKQWIDWVLRGEDGPPPSSQGRG
nr:DNA mismatch repair protein [Pseudozyma thailandica]